MIGASDVIRQSHCPNAALICDWQIYWNERNSLPWCPVVMLCSTCLRSAIACPPAPWPEMTGASKLPRPTALHKKTQSGQLMACASRDVSWCTAPTSPGATRGRQALAVMCRRAPNGALLENDPPPKTLPASHSGRNKRCRLFTTAVPSVQAVHLELQTL